MGKDTCAYVFMCVFVYVYVFNDSSISKRRNPSKKKERDIVNNVELFDIRKCLIFFSCLV